MAPLNRVFIVIGGLSLTTTTILSAYGFHGLADVLSPEKRQSWEWAVQMQAYHSLGLILVAILAHQLGGPLLLKVAGGLMILGMIIFSGLIYAESLGAPEAVGEIVPMGGTCFMIAWAAVALAAFRGVARS